MRAKGKITYEKPTAVSLGPSGSILGQEAVCSTGTGATETCSGVGNNPAVMAYCPVGNIADANCLSGGQAGQYCGVGSDPTLG